MGRADEQIGSAILNNKSRFHVLVSLTLKLSYGRRRSTRSSSVGGCSAGSASWTRPVAASTETSPCRGTCRALGSGSSWTGCARSTPISRRARRLSARVFPRRRDLFLVSRGPNSPGSPGRAPRGSDGTEPCRRPPFEHRGWPHRDDRACSFLILGNGLRPLGSRRATTLARPSRLRRTLFATGG